MLHETVSRPIGHEAGHRVIGRARITFTDEFAQAVHGAVGVPGHIGGQSPDSIGDEAIVRLHQLDTGVAATWLRSMSA
jgi:hypothetical protein